MSHILMDGRWKMGRLKRGRNTEKMVAGAASTAFWHYNGREN